MGIDIYLNGYDAFSKRTQRLKAEFDAAVAARDAVTARGERSLGDESDSFQKRVNASYEAMYSGSMGYIRSSYNSSGLFGVLEEIFGVDVAAYLFPGDWESDVTINGREFVLKVAALEATALLALERKQFRLPWTELFTEVTGKRAPDPHIARVGGEEFGRMVLEMVSRIADVDSIEPKERETTPMLNPDHRWYLTTGIQNLREFGELAAKLNAEGQATFAHISY